MGFDVRYQKEFFSLEPLKVKIKFKSAVHDKVQRNGLNFRFDTKDINQQPWTHKYFDLF